MSGFTTTPDERVGPPPPYTTPSLEANLICRIILGILAILVSIVPMRILQRNGEFAATTLYVVVTILNVFYVVNAILWPDNNVKNWFAGYGWCDLQVYTIFPLTTVYSACVLAMMRNLANRVGLMRATSLSASEKKRRNIIECLILFPVAFVQLILTYFVLAQRYNVSTLIGCMSAYDPSWPFFVFFDLPSPIYTVGAAIYAILTWKRFRQVEKATRAAMNTNNSTMVLRHNRVRRKLYFMTLSIVIPFLPVQFLFLVWNVLSLDFPLKPYDFNQIHHGQNPYPFGFISFTTSDRMGFIDLNNNYPAIISVAPLFWFFGVTKEAINMYREGLLRLGLGRWFPKLHEEYDPDRSRSTRSVSYRKRLTNMISNKWSDTWSFSTTSRSSKEPVLPTAHHISHTSSATGTRKSSDAGALATTTTTNSNPWPEIPPPSQPPAGRNNGDDHVYDRPTTSRNPFIFRTALSNSRRLPLIRIPSFKRKTGLITDPEEQSSSLGTLPRPLSIPSDLPEMSSTGTGPLWVDAGVSAPKVRTRVWSEEDGGVAEASTEGIEPDGVRVETHIASETESVGRAV